MNCEKEDSFPEEIIPCQSSMETATMVFWSNFPTSPASTKLGVNVKRAASSRPNNLFAMKVPSGFPLFGNVFALGIRVTPRVESFWVG